MFETLTDLLGEMVDRPVAVFTSPAYVHTLYTVAAIVVVCFLAIRGWARYDEAMADRTDGGLLPWFGVRLGRRSKAQRSDDATFRDLVATFHRED